MKPRNKTTRITFKHGCWYYRPRASEKALFGGKSWYRLDPDRYVALAKFAEIMRLGVDNTVASVIDRYIIECVPLLRAATRPVYKRGLERLSRVLGHNNVAAITPHVMYQYRDGLISAGRSMNVANADVSTMKSVLDRAVQWGVVPSNLIKGEVKEHIAQILPEMISDTFAEVAKQCDIQGVTFHEVRALSAWIYRKAGHDQKLIQQMMAHSSGKMTEHYQAGHEIEWLDITIEIDKGAV